MRGKLTQLFNESAAKAYEAFPVQLEKLVVLSNGTDMPVYASPVIADRLSQNVSAVKGAIERTTRDMKAMNAAGIAYPFFQVADIIMRAIVVDDTPPGHFTRSYTSKMRGLYILDHEIGHHVVSNGNGSGKHLGEAAADAYASLRHIQRFGQDTDFFTYADKAYTIVLAQSPIHYTNAVFDRVRQIAKERDISAMSLQDTALLAADIAAECHLDIKTLDKIAKAYAEKGVVYADLIGKKQDITEKLYTRDKAAYAIFIRETQDVMKKYAHDADIVKAGKSFLSYPLVKQIQREQKRAANAATPRKAAKTP